MRQTRLLILLAVALLIAACSKEEKLDNEQFAFLDKQGITVTQKLLLGDTLTLPDIYCGDKNQGKNEVGGVKLDHDQYAALILPAGNDFASEMSLWQLLGVRDAGQGITLAAYYVGNNVGYCLYLMTYDGQGQVLDAMNLREMHLVWRCNLDDPDDDNSFSLDGFVIFNGDNGVTLHRTMGRCLMDFDKDLKGSPQWRQTWCQDYLINGKGHFVLRGQRVDDEEGKVDTYAAQDFKSWDMLVCSLHDPDAMNLWNDYALLVDETYDPDYKYNPFPWDVNQLYQMNPQRFLNWMVAHRGPDNRLLRHFKLTVDERPALIDEIGRMDDADARQWLTGIVTGWDNQPLSQHR